MHFSRLYDQVNLKLLPPEAQHFTCWRIPHAYCRRRGSQWYAVPIRQTACTFPQESDGVLKSQGPKNMDWQRQDCHLAVSFVW